MRSLNFEWLLHTSRILAHNNTATNAGGEILVMSTLLGRLKRHDRVVEKIGRLRERHKRVSAQYDIVVKADDKARNAIAVSWTCNHKHQVRDDHAGSYLLRTSLSDWDDERIVRLYWTLSEVEATFRTLKSELGMRNILPSRGSLRNFQFIL